MRTFLDFGPFRLDRDERVLLCEGKPVPLSPKSFDMLMVLVENRGRLLKKDDLMKLVWPDSFVEEGNLSHHVFTVRKALGDEKGDHQIHRDGATPRLPLHRRCPVSRGECGQSGTGHPGWRAWHEAHDGSGRGKRRRLWSSLTQEQSNAGDGAVLPHWP